MTRRPYTGPIWFAVGVVLLILFINFVIIPAYSVPWTGFGPSVTKETTRFAATGEKTALDSTVEQQKPRTVWDWVGLLGVASVVPIVGYLFARHQRKRDEAVANERAQGEALQAFLDQMSNLMIDKKMKIPNKPNQKAVCEVAQARTIAILLALDPDHKRSPLKLVYELGLITKDEPVVALINANLDRANLREVALHGACLRHVNLRGAELSGANLRDSDLSEADLRGVQLANADLSSADLTDANFLPYNELSPAKLSLHNLKTEAIPSKRELRLTRLKPRTKATNLNNTNLEGAILKGTLLGSTDLTEVRGLEQEMINDAIGDDRTRLPDDLQRPQKWDQPIEDQIANLLLARLQDLIQQVNGLVASQTLTSSQGADLISELDAALQQQKQQQNAQQAIEHMKKVKNQINDLIQSNTLASHQGQALIRTVNWILLTIS